MNYPNTRGEYEGNKASDLCQGNHLWRAVVLDGRPIGVTCEGPCGESMPLAEPPNPNTYAVAPEPWVARIGADLPVHLGIDKNGRDIVVSMVLQHIEHSSDGTRMEFVDMMSQLKDQTVAMHDDLMTLRDEVELEKKKINAEVDMIVAKKMAEQDLHELEILKRMGMNTPSNKNRSA